MTAEIEALEPAIVAALADGSALVRTEARPQHIEHIQTHLSHVFLTRDYVYKLHKAVDFGFVCFATQAERNRDCVREVELNRRLAPDVYLGVAPVSYEPADGGWVLGQPILHPKKLASGEHCVVMRRLPDGRDARTLLAADALGPDRVAQVARRVAAFHRAHSLGAPSPYTSEDWFSRITAPVEANFACLLEESPGVVPASRVIELRERAGKTAQALRPAFEARRLAGRAVDGHGDLHLEHIWFENEAAPPVAIDCIAFTEGLRRIDAASDLAFLAMDLGYRGRPDLAAHLLANYVAAADDFGLYRVIDYYVSYRACVRAKVAALEVGDAEIPDAQQAHARERANKRVDYALQVLAPRPPGRVFLVGGIIGAGKSTAARAIAWRTGAAVVSSDVVRRFAEPGDAPRPTSERWQEGSYEPDAVDRVYAGVLDRASEVLEAGRDVVLDASWSKRARRDRARAWAEAHGATAWFVEARCPRALTLERLRTRQARGTDASEAGPEIYDAFAAAFEAPTEWPRDAHWVVDTSAPDWRERLIERLPERDPG